MYVCMVCMYLWRYVMYVFCAMHVCMLVGVCMYCTICTVYVMYDFFGINVCSVCMYV